MKDRKRLLLNVAMSALVLAVAVVAGWLYFGSKTGTGIETTEESVEAHKERRDDRRENQAVRLRRTIEARRRNMAARHAEPDPLAAPPEDEDRSPARLTDAEKTALRGVMEGFYSPDRLREALLNRTAPDLVREMNRLYGETYHARSLGDPANPVPMAPAAREAIQRMGVLKDYGMNLLHAQRPEGQETLQAEMIERINGAFVERIDALNADYPFLDARMLEP